MVALVAIVAVLLIVISAVQTLKIAELWAINKGKVIYEVTKNQNKTQALLMLVF